jgi:hypothetical protein
MSRGAKEVVMVEYILGSCSHGSVIAQAASGGVGVVVKKGLASGSLDPERAIRFVLSHAGVGSLVIGGLSLDHFREHVMVAESVRPGKAD